MPSAGLRWKQPDPISTSLIEEVKQGYWGLAGHPLPDPDFLINDLVPIFEDAADDFSKAYNVPRRRPRGPAK